VKAKVDLANVPMRRFAQPAEIAAAIAFLASVEAAFLTGQTLSLDGGAGQQCLILSPLCRRVGDFADDPSLHASKSTAFALIRPARPLLGAVMRSPRKGQEGDEE
jgi:hypothetical protein